jgi:hypothetical protein
MERREMKWVSLVAPSGDSQQRIETTQPYPGVDRERTTPYPVLAREKTLPYPGLVERLPTPEPETPPRAAKTKSKTKSRVQLQKWIVTAYRVIGFAILTVILLGLVSYLTTTIFYLVSTSWVTPAVISPTDERVLSLKTRQAEQASQRDKLVADRALVAANLADVERIIGEDEKFLESFRRAVSADVADRRAQLRKMRALTDDYVSARNEIKLSNRAYASLSRERNDELKRAGLLDQEGYLSGNYQLSQMAQSNLQLAEKTVELDTRTATLSRDADALTATLRGDGAGALSYDALRIRQEHQRATLELAKARDTRGALLESLAASDRSIARFDRILKSIDEAPLLAAAEGKVTVVLVPYENLPSVRVGGPVYACALGFVVCHRVGTVRDVMPGEMDVHHPFHPTRALRGQAVQVQLTDASAVAETVLFAGRRPLFF